MLLHITYCTCRLPRQSTYRKERWWEQIVARLEVGRYFTLTVSKKRGQTSSWEISQYIPRCCGRPIPLIRKSFHLALKHNGFISRKLTSAVCLRSILTLCLRLGLRKVLYYFVCIKTDMISSISKLYERYCCHGLIKNMESVCYRYIVCDYSLNSIFKQWNLGFACDRPVGLCYLNCYF